MTLQRHVRAATLSVALVALVTGAIYALRPIAPVLSLGVLYVFAVLPVAALAGLGYALLVASGSMLAFNFLFLPPTHTFRLADSENWAALAVYLMTAVSVSTLAARSRRRAEEAERLANDVAGKTAVLRSVSHDLRSPLTAIMTTSELLDDGGESLMPDERAELLAAIRKEVRRVDRLVSNLLELSRLEAGAAEPAPELWPVDGLVTRALHVLGPANERVVVAVDGDSPPVRIDAAQLEHALVNVLENALKFSSERVEVRAEQARREVVLRVVDRGPGIPRAEQDLIFQPFARGTSGDGARGSGLGLAIARGFVTLNGGRMWVESTPGRGATFAIALPAAEPASAA